MDVSIELKEWAQIYVKNRDILQKSVLGFDNLNGDFVVRKSSGDVLFLIRPELSDADEIVEKCTGNCSLVILNTRKNVNFVISNWDKFAKLKGLCVFFVNLGLNEKWLLYPYTHDQITERSALKRGLESLFSMVPSV